MVVAVGWRERRAWKRKEGCTPAAGGVVVMGTVQLRPGRTGNE
jgi:hypothetical protein